MPNGTRGVDPLGGLIHAKLLADAPRPDLASTRQALLLAAEYLEMGEELNSEQGISIRLRLALKLAPREALLHRNSDRVSRYEKVRRHIAAEFGYDDEVTAALSRSVTRAVESWGTARADVSHYRDQLVQRDGNECMNCHLDFSWDSPSLTSVGTRDVYKPIAVSPDSWAAPSVDHIEPVSTFGTNDLDNLELLCRFCNSGKEDSRGPIPKHEYEYGPKLPLNDVDEYSKSGIGFPYLRKVFYMTLERAGRKCLMPDCSSSAELTVRLVRPQSLFVLGNLYAVCYDCLGPASQIQPSYIFGSSTSKR